MNGRPTRVAPDDRSRMERPLVNAIRQASDRSIDGRPRHRTSSTDSLRQWNAEVLADLLREVVVDLGVARNAGRAPGRADEYGMITTFSE